MNLTPYKKVALELEGYTIESLISKGYSMAAAKELKENGKRKAKSIRTYIKIKQLIYKAICR